MKTKGKEYQDLISHWKDKHTNQDDVFEYEESERLYVSFFFPNTRTYNVSCPRGVKWVDQNPISYKDPLRNIIFLN